MKFKLEQAPDVDGTLVPAYGFDHAGDFIVNARVSSCGRFHAAPASYGLTEQEATELARLNADRNLLAYWDL